LVQLEPTASITGTVRAPNDAPVTAGTVSGTGGFASFSVPIRADGTFRVDNLNFGSYLLTAYDGSAMSGARVTTPIVLTGAEPGGVRDMSSSASARRGPRVNPDGRARSGSRTLRQPQSGFGGFYPPTRRTTRVLLAANVPIGDFTVSVVRADLHLRGEASGTFSRRRRVTVGQSRCRTISSICRSPGGTRHFSVRCAERRLDPHGTNDVFAASNAAKTWGGMQLD